MVVKLPNTKVVTFESEQTIVLKLQLCVGPNVYVAGTLEIIFSRPDL
jgi:hypothetical protein